MSESRMNFQEFVDKVKEAIQDALPESFRDAQVSVEPFRKLNTSYLGLQVKREGQTVVPNINLDAHFREYQETGKPFADVLTAIAEQVQLAPPMETEWLKDYSQVKEKLFIRVSDAKENEAFLRMAPHKEVDGLAISYHIAFEGLHGVEASTPVTYKMIEMLGVTEEQLHADALESTQRLYPVQYTSMAEVMNKMMGIDADMDPDMMPATEGPQLMVLTNMQGIHGAATLFYPGQLEAIAQQMGSDFFVLPSSVHETLILPDDGTVEPDSLQFMVREINQSTVAPEDRLSDFVYHYDAKDHVLEKAETFALRMAQKEQEAEKAAAEAEQKGPEQMEPEQKDSERKDPSPERKDAGKDDRKPERDSDSRRDKGKEKTSVLARLNDKKEKLKAQPKKDVPGRKQEAAIG
ncbi:MAG: hypothetical protein IJ106_14910 [Parasporobacterium sp.]|nr:hypothetical protein [Parasporobacterium sp.]